MSPNTSLRGTDHKQQEETTTKKTTKKQIDSVDTKQQSNSSSAASQTKSDEHHTGFTDLGEDNHFQRPEPINYHGQPQQQFPQPAPSMDPQYVVPLEQQHFLNLIRSMIQEQIQLFMPPLLQPQMHQVNLA